MTPGNGQLTVWPSLRRRMVVHPHIAAINRFPGEFAEAGPPGGGGCGWGRPRPPTASPPCIRTLPLSIAPPWRGSRQAKGVSPQARRWGAKARAPSVCATSAQPANHRAVAQSNHSPWEFAEAGPPGGGGCGWGRPSPHNLTAVQPHIAAINRSPLEGEPASQGRQPAGAPVGGKSQGPKRMRHLRPANKPPSRCTIQSLPRGVRGSRAAGRWRLRLGQTEPPQSHRRAPKQALA